MKNNWKLIIVGLALAVSAKSQVFVLDNFNTATLSGTVDGATSWNGTLSFSSTTMTVGASAKDDSGWVATFGSLTDLSSYTFLSITAQRDSGNLAANLSLTLNDDNGTDYTTITIPTSSFALGSLTTVTVGFAWTGLGQEIAGWNLGGGQASPGSAAFRMTFDNVQLQTMGAIPEPSTYAAILGVMALGFVAYRRRQQAA